MSNFVRAKPSGWAANEIFTDAQVNQIDIDHTKAVNGDDGSTHTPSSAVSLLGITNGLIVQRLRNSAADGSIEFTADDDTSRSLTIATKSGTGALAGGSLQVQSQSGQAQTGSNTNNNGGNLRLIPGLRGAGGSGTAGQGFGGAALDGALECRWGDQTQRRRLEWSESFDLAAAAAATKAMNVSLPVDKAAYLLKIEVVSIQDGGGSSLLYAAQSIWHRIKREGTTVSIGPQQTVMTSSTFTTAPPAVDVVNVGDGSLNVRLAGAPSETSANTVYVQLLQGRVSA